ncbi:MAG: flagellar biosynthetic protein FliR [Oceanococcaceae bacterium]
MESDLLLSFESLVEGLWLSMRVAGLWIALPVFGSAVLPARQRLLLTIATTVLLVLALDGRVDIPEPGTPAFYFSAAMELVVGLLLGFAMRLAFEAMLLSAELISLAMGLGFAQMNDPLRGTSAPVLGSLFSVITTLVFLSLDGHLRMMEWLAWSYLSVPVSGASLAGVLVENMLSWSGWFFVHAVQVAMPALIALLIVNIGFGVISRSAPALNLLAIGFPAALLLGLLVLAVMSPIIVEQAGLAISQALMWVREMVG